MKLMVRSNEWISNRQWDMSPVPQALILELLNHAVWAPNHRNREPWRFIYISRNNTGGLDFIQAQAPGYLIITMNNENDANKQNENLAAVFCLIQNFRLLAWEQKLGANVCFYEWMYDRRNCQQLGVMDKERIVAVLEVGFCNESSAVVPTSSAAVLNWRSL
ncbi:nitroreductase [Paenibacillus cellulosilyticus]|uniref:Nitroreductase n=1 Tax=Paenibacillus cellulosilyticus TaxID=375489 RepID=A0A2V2YQY2_9BACL|nr:nitroreductase family protein [Paenibacillus cellulosilyticus]PWV99468.1 nitroreductase [Paenibacillus cellulosilyticus]QKS44724.1 nitroreductase family protein [Paenibacillus cellulosilyticus]